VSDFLARIAERAVGAAARAQPRVVGPFVGAGDDLEVVDEEIVVPGAVSPPERPPEPVRLAAPSPEAAVPMPVTAADPAASIPPAAAPTGSAAELPRLERPLPAREPAAASPAQAGLAAPPAEPAAAVTVVALPSAPTVAAHAAPVRPSTVAAARDEQPPVRVHIGRLEVRANLGEPPPRPQPLPTPREPEGLSLSDYLRGKRGA